MTRAIFGLFKLFRVHEHNEFGVRLYGANVVAHAGAFRSVTAVTLFSIPIDRLHQF